MAQKLAFVLIALLGFANADFAASSSGIVRIFGVPTRATGSLTHDDHDDGPQLGQHGVVLGQEVKLGEEDHHNGQDDEPQYQVVNFVKPVSQVKDNRDDTKADDHDGRLPKSGNHQNGSDRPVSSNGQQRQKGESSRFDRNSQSYRGDKSQKSGWYKQSNSNNAPSKSNENGKSAPIVVVTVSKPEKEQKSNFKPQHQDDHDDHENTQVQIPIFGKLKYVDNDPHGEAVKAPITIVTAPLVSTAQTEHHKVPINEVVGKTNCPECKEQKRESKEHVKSSNKALSKNVDLLTTQIKGPIDNVVVKPEHHDHDESSCEDNDDEDHHHGATHDSHGAAIINQKKLKKDLATGEARENAPFVVGSVVVTSNNNLTHDDDDNDNRRPTNSGRRHD